VEHHHLKTGEIAWFREGKQLRCEACIVELRVLTELEGRGDLEVQQFSPIAKFLNWATQVQEGEGFVTNSDPL